MADASPDAERQRQREEFARLVRVERKSPEEAYAIATAPPRNPTMGKGQSLVRGIAQGGSLGFGDEIAGAMGAAASSLGLLDNKENLSFGDAYRLYRDEARRGDDIAEDSNKKTFIAGQLAGGAATAPMLPGGAVSTYGRAALTGAGYGAASGLGASDADLTHGEYGDAAIDTGVGAAIGAAIGPAVHGAGRGARWLWGKIRPGAAERIAADATQATEAAARGGVQQSPLSPKAAKVAVDEARKAAESFNKPSSIGSGRTVAETAKESRAIERWAKSQGEDLRFFPDQATGTRSAALARRRAAQFDPTMDEMQAMEAAQNRIGTRLLDKMVDHVAKNPERLGSPELMRSVGTAVRLEGKALYNNRTAAAAPIYAAYERAGGGVNSAGIIGAIQREISPFKAKGLQGQLKGLIAEVEKRGAGGGMSVKEANEIRKIMGDVIHGEDSFLDGVDMDVQGKIARRIRDSIDDAFDEVVGTPSEEAVALLRQGNKVWREHTQHIDSVMTDAVELITRKSATDAAESIPSRLIKMHPAQVRGVFSIVRKQSPGDASDLLASMIEQALVNGGKPMRGAPLAEAAGVQRLGAQGALSALQKMEPLLHAAAPDGKTRAAYARMYGLLDRLRHGPNIQGSDTAAKAHAPMMDATRKVVGAVNESAARVMDHATAIADRITNSNAALAEAMSHRQGIDAFSAALELFIARQEGRMTPEIAGRLIDSAGRAGLLTAPRVAAEGAVDAIADTRIQR